MFDLGERPVTCALLQDEVDTCKHHCTTSYCNEGDMNMVKTKISCQVCSQEVNHVGTPLSGDQGQGSSDADYRNVRIVRTFYIFRAVQNSVS